jgi:Tol biopolymer transport system component
MRIETPRSGVDGRRARSRGGARAHRLQQLGNDGYLPGHGRIVPGGVESERHAPAGAADESQPAWSPDGGRIAYAVSRLADPLDSPVRVMNANGTGKRKLQSALASWSQAWSPDGTQIAFAQRALYTGAWAGALGLAVVNVDGSDLRELTLTSDPHVGDQYPAWSPDGRISFLRVRIGDVLWVDSDGSGSTRVTASGGHGAFALSPNGKQLAIYDREHDHLVLIPASGGGTPVVLVDDMSQYVTSQSVRLAW